MRFTVSWRFWLPLERSPSAGFPLLTGTTTFAAGMVLSLTVNVAVAPFSVVMSGVAAAVTVIPATSSSELVTVTVFAGSVAYSAAPVGGADLHRVGHVPVVLEVLLAAHEDVLRRAPAWTW